jgi:hypothetical protein
MNLRKNILSAILLSIGFILHQVIPTFEGVTFDVQLAMLFIIIAINMDIKNTVVVSLASGIITALTTKLPGGQIPNIIDKAITGMAVYLLLLALSRIVNKPAAAAVTGFIGTIVSGSVFLSSALLILGKLPAPFMFLFMTVVIPTALANTAVTPILYSLVTFSKRAAKLEF